MNTPISIRIPYETGEQLREIAAARDLPVTETIALLLDHAARTGFCEPPALPGFQIDYSGGDTLALKIDSIATVSLSAADATSIGAALRNAATAGKTFLNMDSSVPIEVSRTGAAVVMKLCGEHGAVVHKHLARGVALALADRLEAAAREVRS